uniref:Galectin n=1 Tax=Meloidogyne javanica TaxID=6303 RepID=A0A915LTU1_MELJA
MFSRYFSKFSRLSATIFLIVFNGFVNSAGYSTIGEGRHTIENGTVTLANGSRIATREDVYEYQIQPLACSVEIDAEGNIILNFDWFTKNAFEGCTVDLVTEIGSDKETNVEFTVSIDHFGELNTCMSCGGYDWMSGNIIPFVFNIDSDEFDKLVQMPPNEWPCQQPWNKLWSSSEIRICYSDDEIQIGSFIDTPEFLNFWPWCHRDENRTFENLKQLEFNVEINGETFVVNHTDYNFSRCNSESLPKPLCSPVQPKVWPILGNAQLEGKGLLAFSLLPKYQEFHLGCDFVSLKFSGKKYSLLTTLPPKPLTTMNGTIDEIITLFKSNNGDFDYESSTSDLSQNLTGQLNMSSIQTNKTSIIAKTNGTTMFNTSTNKTSTGGNLTDEQTTPTDETTINETYSGTPQIIPAIIVFTTEATTTEETTLLVETSTEDFFTTTDEGTTDEDPTDEVTTEDTTDEDTTEHPTEETSIPTTSTTTTKIVTSSEMTTTFIDPTTTSASPTEEETTSTSQT